MAEEENSGQSFEEFLAKRKINLDELEEQEREKLDIDKIKARNIENTRLKALPFTNLELKRMNLEIETNILQSIFKNCYDR